MSASDKYEYSFRVWGRNLYNPDTDPDGWQRLLRRQFGRGAEAAEGALASAGKILPLVTTAHCPSAANNNFWPEIYVNMPIVNAVDANRRHPYGDSPSPKRFGTVSPLDPEFFSTVDEFADELLKGEFSGRGKVEISRFKGLGEMLPGQLKETTMDPAKRALLRVQVLADEKTTIAKVVEQLMGNKPEERFKFISARAKFVSDEALDV